MDFNLSTNFPEVINGCFKANMTEIDNNHSFGFDLHTDQQEDLPSDNYENVLSEIPLL